MTESHESGQLSLDFNDSAELARLYDRARGSLDELFLLARKYRTSKEYMELLSFLGRFHRYSPFNAMLVYTQMPGARHVLPAKRWLKEYGRIPTREAQPLVMLQPRGPVMFGFDVSQTEGRGLPNSFEDQYRPVGKIVREEYEKMLENCRRAGILVEFKQLGGSLSGYVRNAHSDDHVIGIGLVRRTTKQFDIGSRRVEVVAEITLNANHSDESNFATLTHELGHLYCGHVGTFDDTQWPDRKDLEHSQCEFEAESVSYLVCQRAGLNSPAEKYLSGYLQKESVVPEIDFGAVMKATQRIDHMRTRLLPIQG